MPLPSQYYVLLVTMYMRQCNSGNVEVYQRLVFEDVGISLFVPSL